MSMKLPSFNKDWAIMLGTGILAISGMIALHNRFASIVPTIPGVRYGPGGPATGIYTGAHAPYSPVPVAEDIYMQGRPIIDPVTGEVQSLGRQGVGAVQSMWGGWSGDIGRGQMRDRWAEVYDPKKNTGGITHDMPEHRVSLA